MKNMLQKVQWCGGSVQKDTGTKLTQLVAANSMGEKYQYATTFSIPVLTEGWLSFAWSHRDEVETRADTKEAMNKFKLPIFAGNIVQFYGFEASELTHMQEVLVANGGKVASSPTERTHLVVDENTVEVLPASQKRDPRWHLGPLLSHRDLPPATEGLPLPSKARLSFS